MLITVIEENIDKRLDKFLKELYPDLSRSYLQKSIEAGQVLVNGKKVPPHHFLKLNETVEIKIEPPKEVVVEPNPAVQFKVFAEEQDFLIINKPAGLVVHQGEGHKEADTLVNGLLVRYPEIAKVGEDLLRPGIIHRLDKEASGVMVIARTQNMFDHLKEQFKLHKVSKEYLALAHGQVSPPSGTIEFAIGRKGAKMVARPKGEIGKKAETEYEVITPHPIPLPQGERRGEGVSLLKITTHTGRTHQIRVHFFALGHPIVGDPLYKLKMKSEKLKIIEPKRLMLHAQKLGFYDLNNKWCEYEAPTPKEFKKYIEIRA